MSRIRTIKPDFFLNEDIAGLNYSTRLLFIGLWTIADKKGRLEDRPKRIKAKLFPYDKINIEHMLNKLTPEFIVRYEVNNHNYIQVKNFQKHQRPHHTESDSVIPPYNGELTVNSPLLDGENPAGKEGKGKERKGKERIYVDFEKEVHQSWNSFCKNHPILAEIREISDKRRAKLKKRFEKESFRSLKAILEAIAEQPFLLGENSRKWKVSFDWLIENDTNYLKVLERKYKDHKTEKELISRSAELKQRFKEGGRLNYNV